MTERRKRGRETLHRLLEWEETQGTAERLAGHVLSSDGYTSVDLVHPRGGPDGGKDLLCVGKDHKKYCVAVYFPKGKLTFGRIRSKFNSDISKLEASSTEGFIFFVNQYLTMKQREQLKYQANPFVGENVEIYHLERIALLMDQPRNYGFRHDFLDIEMSKAEQVAFFTGHFHNIEHSVRTWERGIMASLQELLSNFDINELPRKDR